MKLSFLSSLMVFSGKHLRTLLILLIATILGVGGYYGWSFYRYRQSCQFTFTELQRSMTSAEVGKLAAIVDFNTISEEMARAMAKSFPFFRSGPDQVHELKNIIQSQILKAVLDQNNEQSKKEEGETDTEKLLMQPLQILPSDSIAQLAGNLSLKTTDEDSALITSFIQHPTLDTKFELLMRMVKTPDGWILRNFVNAGELIAQFRQLWIARLEARHAILVNKRAAVLKRMENTLAIRSCSAGAGLLSDGKTILAGVHVTALNKSKLTVKNIALDVRLCNAEGKTLLRRILNATCDLASGMELDRRWTIELDVQSEEGRSLLAAGTLQCIPTWRTLSLSSSEVLHVEDIEPVLQPCGLSGHKHPQDFCLKEVFSE